MALELMCEDGGHRFWSARERNHPHYCRSHIEYRRKIGCGPLQGGSPTPAQQATLEGIQCDPGIRPRPPVLGS